MENINLLSINNLISCAALYAAVFSAPPWNELWTESAANIRLQETFATPGFIGLGCYVDDQLQGFAIGQCEEWLNNKQFYLKEMCVNTTMQGKGIGKKLLLKLKEVLQQQSVSKIYLLTMRDSPAQHFYAAQGFISSDKMVVMGCPL
jgi:aminoglycoside 6'-N-acetyltransferase I